MLFIVGDIRAGEDREIFDDFRHLYSNTRIMVTRFVFAGDLQCVLFLDTSLVSTISGNGLAPEIDQRLVGENMRQGASTCQTIRNKFMLQTELDGNLMIYDRLGLKM